VITQSLPLQNAPSDVETVEKALEKTTSRHGHANPMWSLWPDDFVTCGVRKVLRTGEQQQLNELFS
jgi:hypothetical protein